MSAIHTLTFPRDGALGCDREAEARLEVAARLLSTVAAVDDDAVVVLPAGAVVADSDAQRDAWAEHLRVASQESGVGIVFGIDVVERAWDAESRPRSFGYACDRGRPALWPVVAGSGELTERVVTVGAFRLMVLFGRELFRSDTATAAAAGRPDLVLVLAHAGATAKWVAPLQALDAAAPTLVVRQDLPLRRPVWTGRPRGWSAEPGRRNRAVHLVCYRRPAVGVARPIVGH